ncbi:hypothetical protein [Faecalimonas sp.]
MAKFCTKCGKRLEEGEVCTCTQQVECNAESQVENNAESQAESWNGGQPTINQTGEKTKEAEWISAKSTIVVNETKNIFSKIIPLLKNPVVETKNIANGKSSIPGLEFIGLKALVALIFTIIMLVKMDSALGGYIDIPKATVIIMVLLLTLGADCLEALLLKVFSGVLNGVTDQSAMYTVVGTRALFETLIFLVSGVLCFVSFNFGCIIYALGKIILPVVEFAGYRVLVQADEDRKIYAYFIAKVVMAIIIYIVVYLFGKEMLTSVMGTLLGGLLKF